MNSFFQTILLLFK